jgi:hypothetical protein
MAILVFRFVSAAFLACFLRKEDKRALLSLLLKALGGGSREVNGEEADGEETDGKVVHGKDAGNGKAGSKKVRGFLVDFVLSIFSLSTKSYKERFGTYFLKSY